MEEENEKNPDFDATSINAVKTGLMGPLSAIGDTLFPTTLRILATSLVIGMAAAGNVFAPVLFLLMYNIPNVLARWYSLKYGYSMGTEFLLKSEPVSYTHLGSTGKSEKQWRRPEKNSSGRGC